MSNLKTSDYEALPDKGKDKQYNLCYLVFVTLSATLNSFLCGYQIGVFNTCQDNVSHSLGWADNKTILISVMTALMPLGGMVGSMSAGLAANKLGRKLAMIVTCCVMLLSAGLVRDRQNVISDNYSFGIARFLGGIVAGMGSTIPPVFGTPPLSQRNRPSSHQWCPWFSHPVPNHPRHPSRLCDGYPAALA